MPQSLTRTTGLILVAVTLCNFIAATELFAEAGLKVNIQPREAEENATDDYRENTKNEILIVAVPHFKSGKIKLELLDGKIYNVINSDKQIGMQRLGQDVLYLYVTPVKITRTGADVILGVWSNSNFHTEEARALKTKYWERIKKKKEQLGDHQWLRYHK